MKKLKFVLLAIILAFAAFIIAPATVVAAPELGQSIVFVQVPDDWETPRIWAWGPRGNAAATDWPGELYLLQDPGNPGWHFIWLPADKTGGLINEGGGAQTNDFPLTGEPVWVTVSGPGEDFTVTTTPQTTGDFPSATVAIFAQIPDGWETPRVWAWGPRGDASPVGWPGNLYMRQVPGNEGWYFFHLPADKTGALINEGGGSQTGDFPLAGQHVWVTVTNEDGDFTVSDTQQTTGPIPQMYTIIYAQLPDGWERPAVWAWGPRGNAAATDWPGELVMQEDANNPGWFYIYIPSDKTGALINGVGIQTNDFPFAGRPIWVTVSGEGGDFTVSEAQQTAGPFAPFALVSLTPPIADVATALAGGAVEMVPVFAQVPAHWGTPGFWGWGPRGNLYDGDWPGPAMNADPNNPGWFYIFVPADTAGIIVNYGVDGGPQTSNIMFADYGVPLWITIHDEDIEEGNTDDFTVTTEQQTDGALPTMDPIVFDVPEPVYVPDVDMIAVRAFITPEDWEGPALWAWGPYGDVFIGWPGEPFAERDGDWYILHIPGWADNIIINALGGTVQTIDIPVEPGRDIWITIVNEIGGFQLEYEAFDPLEAEVAERAPPVVIAADPQADLHTRTTPVEADSNGNSTTVIIIIVIVAVVLAVVCVCVVVIFKKKKK